MIIRTTKDTLDRQSSKLIARTSADIEQAEAKIKLLLPDAATSEKVKRTIEHMTNAINKAKSMRGKILRIVYAVEGFAPSDMVELDNEDLSAFAIVSAIIKNPIDS